MIKVTSVCELIFTIVRCDMFEWSNLLNLYCRCVCVLGGGPEGVRGVNIRRQLDISLTTC